MKEYLKVSLSLAVVCVVITFLLALVNSITAPKIAEAESKKAVALCSKVYPAESFKETDVPENLKSAVSKIYLANDGGMVIAAKSNGYGGEMVIMVGIKDGKISGTTVLSSKETADRAEKIASEAFSNRFSDKTRENFKDVDTIASATVSSKAYKKAVENAFSAYYQMKGADVK